MVSKFRNFWLCVFSGVVATTLIGKTNISLFSWYEQCTYNVCTCIVNNSRFAMYVVNKIPKFRRFSRVLIEAIVLTGNLITGLNTTRIFFTEHYKTYYERSVKICA